jgi:hypothetical protein
VLLLKYSSKTQFPEGGVICFTIPGYNPPRDVKADSEIPKARGMCFLAEKEGER